MRVGIVGLGRMGRVHLQALQQLQVEKIVGFDINPSAIQGFSNEFRIPCHGVDALVDVIDAESLNGIIFSSTTLGRAALISLALERPLTDWVLTEKPLASSLKEATELGLVAKKFNGRLGVNHQMRFMNQYSFVRDLVVSERYGPFVGMSVSAANIGLANNGTHYVEAFRYVSGQNLSKVTGWIDDVPRKSHRGPDFVDYSGSFYGTTDQGTSLFMDMGQGAGVGIFATYTFRQAKVVIDEMAGTYSIVARDERDYAAGTDSYGKHPATWEHGSLSSQDLLDITRSVILSVAADENFPNYAAGIHALAAVVAAIYSSEQGSVPILLEKILEPNGQGAFEREFTWS